MTTISQEPCFATPPYPIRKFTVDEYHRMIDAGIITEDDNVELLEGWIVPKMGHKPPHDGTIELVAEALRSRLPNGWKVRIQSVLNTPDSEPEPDLAVVAGNARTHLGCHPGADDTALVIEVADSTLTRDRQDKARLYARAGLVCYWIVNLIDDRIEVFTDPSGPTPNPAYGKRHDSWRGDEVSLILAGKEVAHIPVTELLP